MSRLVVIDRRENMGLCKRTQGGYWSQASIGSFHIISERPIALMTGPAHWGFTKDPAWK
jgi:hypothetical protein